MDMKILDKIRDFIFKVSGEVENKTNDMMDGNSFRKNSLPHHKHRNRTKKKNSDYVYSEITSFERHGNTWYRVNGCNRMRDGDRVLKAGDAIIYKKGEMLCFMIIMSFDFDSDTAARAYFGREKSLHNWDYAPAFNEFRKASRQEIVEFFNGVDINKLPMDHLVRDFPEYSFFTKH